MLGSYVAGSYVSGSYVLGSYVAGNQVAMYSRRAFHRLRDLATNIRIVTIINHRFEPTNREYDI